MSSTHPQLAAAVATLAAEVDALRMTTESGVDLGTRLDTVEHELSEAQARLATLATVAEVGQAGQSSAPGSAAYQYPNLDTWVDEVFARLAARHQARWCPRWDQHFEAAARLDLLWHTWEASHTQPPDYRGRDEWARVVFDHHTPWLLDREGPFAGCAPDRCAIAPRLLQRTLVTRPLSVVASLAAHPRDRATAAGVAR